MECINSTKWLEELLPTDKILLINPPVQEVRYAWIRWNQPTSLLTLSSKLKNEVGCEIEILDFMLPNESGRVSIRDLAKQRVVNGETYKTRTYGMPVEEASLNLRKVTQDWKPTHIVINTLTTYWFEMVWTLIPYLKTLVMGCKVSLVGPYPVFETKHSLRSGADFIVTDFIDTSEYNPDFELYFQPNSLLLNGSKKPIFGGLKFTSHNPIENILLQIKNLKENNIRDAVIFEENLFANEAEILSGMLDNLQKQGLQMNFHALCGLEIADASEGIYNKMRLNGYRSFYLEYNLDGCELNLDNYRRAYSELSLLSISSGSLAGFLMIGKAEDDLERLFKHSFNLLEMFGSIIPKPFTPNIGSDDYKTISLSGRLDKLSPHIFPLAEKSGISRAEYMEFYQHTSFLNEKRLGNSFDFFDDQYCSIALRRSLGKKG